MSPHFGNQKDIHSEAGSLNYTPLPFPLGSLESCEVKVKCSGGLNVCCKSLCKHKKKEKKEKQAWPPDFTAFPESPYFAFQKERQGVSEVDTPEVSGRTCVHVCVFV